MAVTTRGPFLFKRSKNAAKAALIGPDLLVTYLAYEAVRVYFKRITNPLREGCMRLPRVQG